MSFNELLRLIPAVPAAWPVGRIPFDFIESIDWHPDEYWGCPHFYCRFANPFGEPYEDVIYRARLYPEVSKNLHVLAPIRNYDHSQSVGETLRERSGARAASSSSWPLQGRNKPGGQSQDNENAWVFL